MHEKDTIRRLGEEFAEWRQVYQQSSNVRKGTQKEHEERWRDKQMHGYLQKTIRGRHNRHEENK